MSRVAVNLIPGMKVKVKCPVSYTNAGGFFAKTGDVTLNTSAGTVKKTLVRGFALEDDKVGSIKASSEDSASVVYEHKKPLTNAIWFFAETGEIGVLDIVAVPIHDHSSIVQGGPAFGTYFSDDETENPSST